MPRKKNRRKERQAAKAAAQRQVKEVTKPQRVGIIAHPNSAAFALTLLGRSFIRHKTHSN